MAMDSPKLPDEIMLNILTFLPVKSLCRSKCVSKLWNTLFLRPSFPYLHRCDGVPFDFPLLTTPFTKVARSSQGLDLEKTSSPPLRYRVSCYPLVQFLEIPNPQNPSTCIALEFVPSNQAVKLVSVHEDDERDSFGYEVLSLGVGSGPETYTWRSIKVPPPPSNQLQNSEPRGKRKRIELFFRKEVAYCIWYTESDDIEVDVLDMVNEIYVGHTTFPRGNFFSSSNLSTSTTINRLDWNGQLAFAQLVEDELHVLVLDVDDFRTLKWATRIIKLTFLKPNNNNKKERLTFYTRAGNLLHFVGRDKKSLCNYNIYSGELSATQMPRPINSAEEVSEIVAYVTFILEEIRRGAIKIDELFNKEI